MRERATAGLFTQIVVKGCNKLPEEEANVESVLEFTGKLENAWTFVDGEDSAPHASFRRMVGKNATP